MNSSTGTGSLAKGGPVTQEGKEVVKWNSTKHGIRSPAPVVPGVEKKEDWEEHRDGVLESLSPVGHLEFVLAERVALLSWRLHRVTRYETESIALFQEKAEDDLAKERRFESGPAHPEAVRGNAKSDEQDYKLLKRFTKMKDDKRLSSLDADIIIWGAMECADKVAEGEVDPDELLESISVPGLPDSDSWEGYEGWTAGLVRAVIEKIAQATDEEPEELLEAATRDARFKMERTKREAEKVEQDLRNMARGRLLPDEKTLEKVARYEAHLSRGLYKALHELEALQVRRAGGAAPLARLDVDGLAGS
jgi:predicted transcriptional regulator